MPESAYSTKQLSSLLGVSVSSIKRWADEGLIPCIRTPGGHRKFREADVKDFAASAGLSLRARGEGVAIRIPEEEAAAHALMAHPDVLSKSFKDHLLGGRDDGALRILTNAYQAGMSLSRLIDEIIGPAFHQIGAEWENGEIPIHEQHLASATASMAVTRFIERMGPATVKEHGGVAVCSCGAGEAHDLCIILVTHLLKTLGWAARSLGADTPYEEISECVRRVHPLICVVSATCPENTLKHVDDIAALAQVCRTKGAKLILGGQGFTKQIAEQVGADIQVNSCHELIPYLDSVRPRRRGRPRKIQVSARRDLEPESNT